jgi:hypothetical protein
LQKRKNFDDSRTFIRHFTDLRQYCGHRNLITLYSRFTYWPGESPPGLERVLFLNRNRDWHFAQKGEVSYFREFIFEAATRGIRVGVENWFLKDNSLTESLASRWF